MPSQFDVHNQKHCTLYFHLTAFTPLKWHTTVTVEDDGIQGCDTVALGVSPCSGGL